MECQPLGRRKRTRQQDEPIPGPKRAEALLQSPESINDASKERVSNFTVEISKKPNPNIEYDVHVNVGRPGCKKVKSHNFARAMRIKASKSKTDLLANYAEAIAEENPYKVEWGKAIQIELKALKKNKTWEEVIVTDNGQGYRDLNPLSTRWVFVKKPMQNGRVKFKARLVVRGFEQKYGINYRETFAPTAAFQSIRSLLALSARMRLQIHQMDVKTAFINSPLTETVHIQTPEGLDDTHTPVLRLRKALYGLKQAPQAWNDLINQKFKELGFKCCLSDYCIYVKESIIMALYVDDILIISDNQDEINKT